MLHRAKIREDVRREARVEELHKKMREIANRKLEWAFNINYRGHKENLEVMEMFTWIVVMVSWIYTYVKTEQMIYLNMYGLLYFSYTSIKLFKNYMISLSFSYRTSSLLSGVLWRFLPNINQPCYLLIVTYRVTQQNKRYKRYSDALYWSLLYLLNFY